MKDRQEETKHFNRDIYVVREFFYDRGLFQENYKKTQLTRILVKFVEKLKGIFQIHSSICLFKD